MGGTVICNVGDIQRSLIGEYLIAISIVYELIACFLQKLDRLCKVVLVCIIGRIIVSDCICIRVSISIVILTELSAVAVCHTCRNKGICQLLTGLADVLYDVVTVDQKGKSTSHGRSLLRSLACEQIAVYIKCYIIGTEVVDDVELRIVQKALDLIGRNRICEIKVTCIVCSVDCSIICTEHELHALDLHFICTVVVRVLHINHALIVVPALQCVSAARHEACFLAPCTRILLPALCCLNACLRNRIECRECTQVKEVCTRCTKLHGKRLAILACLDIQCSVILSCDRIKHVCIVCTGLSTCGTVPGIYEILCGQLGTVAPLQAILHRKGIGQSILACLIAVCKIHCNLAILIIGAKSVKAVDCKACTVNRCI